jgi:regulation of enolase protein 1 (concanavalin A-like superfamily)
VSVVLPGMPPLHWQEEPVSWRADGDVLTITAGPRTDLFVDPGDGTETANAPRLVAELEGDFLFSARVRAELAATYDAGVLLLWVDERHWAKLCLEYSPHAVPTIVSVVTRTVSDDANAIELAGPESWLRIARLGDAFAFHASTDGEFWSLIRYFRLDAPDRVRAGFLAQSPTGEGCTAMFDRVSHAAERLRSLRSGA